MPSMGSQSPQPTIVIGPYQQALIDQGVPDLAFKDFNYIISFVCAIGLSFTLAATTSDDNDKSSQTRYGIASVLLIASLFQSITCSLLLTIPQITRYLTLSTVNRIVKGEGVRNREKTTGLWNRFTQALLERVVTVLAVMSWLAACELGAAFYVIGFALFWGGQKGVGIALFAVLSSCILVGFILLVCFANAVNAEPPTDAQGSEMASTSG